MPHTIVAARALMKRYLIIPRNSPGSSLSSNYSETFHSSICWPLRSIIWSSLRQPCPWDCETPASSLKRTLWKPLWRVLFTTTRHYSLMSWDNWWITMWMTSSFLQTPPKRTCSKCLLQSSGQNGLGLSLMTTRGSYPRCKHATWDSVLTCAARC